MTALSFGLQNLSDLAACFANGLLLFVEEGEFLWSSGDYSGLRNSCKREYRVDV